MAVKNTNYERRLIRLSGDDRLDFLQGLITQDLSLLSPDSGLFASLLTPQGKILFDFFVTDYGDCLLIDVHKEAADALRKRLMLYKLRAKVSIDIDDTLRILTSPTRPEIDATATYQDPRLASLGWRAITATGAPQETTYHERRIKFGVPEFGYDFDDDEVFLLDVNYDYLSGVSYKKGCFIGQEVTSRMKRKGDARRRALIAETADADVLADSDITSGDSRIGEIRSANGKTAIAFVRLDRVEKVRAAGDDFYCGETRVTLRTPAYLGAAASL